MRMRSDFLDDSMEVQKKLKHKNVLRLYQHFEDADCVYLLLESASCSSAQFGDTSSD